MSAAPEASQDQPEEAKKVTMSVVDELTAVMLQDPACRKTKFETLQFFLKTLPEDLRNARRAHVVMATILTAISSWEPYDDTFEDSKKPAQDEDKLLHNMPPLMLWSFDDWEALSDHIFDLLNSIDANEDSQLEKVMMNIILHQTLAKIRATLESQVRSKSSGPVKISAENISEILKATSSLDPAVSEHIEQLLIRSEGKKTRAKNKNVALKEIQDLKPILSSEPFDLKAFAGKVNKLMMTWAIEYIPTIKSYLLENMTQSKTPQKKESKKKATAKRKEKVVHETVGKGGGIKIVDDGEDDQVASPPARASTSSRAYSSEKYGKKRKKRVEFTEEEKHAITEAYRELGEGHWIGIKQMYSELLRSRPSKTIKNFVRALQSKGELETVQVLLDDKEDEMADADQGDEEESPKKKPKVVSRPNPVPPPRPDGRKERRKWTDEEKAAIFHGVRMFSVGEWAKIKAHYKEQLATRTNVQIKDCYRTMMKNGEA